MLLLLLLLVVVVICFPLLSGLAALLGVTAFIYLVPVFVLLLLPRLLWRELDPFADWRQRHRQELRAAGAIALGCAGSAALIALAVLVRHNTMGGG